MFNSIVENVLNEINAKDAYEKFYSSLPSEEYFNLVNMYGKFDNLIKFILNCIIEGECGFGDAQSLISKLKSLPNESRIDVLNKFKINMFLSVSDMEKYVDLVKVVGVFSEKKLCDIGFINVYSDDKYDVTCTTTYSANHHYFCGKTSWCTASGRDGRYDGWVMFLRYTLGYQPHVPLKYEELRSDALTYILVQCYEKETKKLYQFQVYDNGGIGLVCDEKDKSANSYNCESYSFIKEIMKDEFPELMSIFRKCFDKEVLYIKNSEEYNEAVKKIEKERLRKKYIVFLEKIKKSVESKLEFINKKLNEIKSSNLLNNYDFIKEIIDYSNNNPPVRTPLAQEDSSLYMDFEEKLKSHGYIMCTSSNDYYGYKVFELSIVLGIIKNIECSEDGTIYLNDWFYGHNGLLGILGQDRLNVRAPDFQASVIINENEENGKITSVIEAKGIYDIASPAMFCFKNNNIKNFIFTSYINDDDNEICKMIDCETGLKIDCASIGIDYEYLALNDGNLFCFCGNPECSKLSITTLFTLNPFKKIGEFCIKRINFDETAKILFNNDMTFLYWGGHFIKIDYRFGDSIIFFNKKSKESYSFNDFLSTDYQNALYDNISIYDVFVGTDLRENNLLFKRKNPDGLYIIDIYSISEGNFTYRNCYEISSNKEREGVRRFLFNDGENRFTIDVCDV